MQPLIAADRIRDRIRELAAEIHRDHPDGVHLVGILKGSFVFLADLLRALPGPATVDFIAVSSYGRGTTSSGEVRLLKELDDQIGGRDVLLVEDIVDSGRTLAYLLDLLRPRGPRTLRTACLLRKPEQATASAARKRQAGRVPVDYVGFEIGDVFVVGYGLDHADAHRNLPYIAVVDPPQP